jgi:hypothetical protein
MTFQFLCPQGHLLQGEEAHMGMQCQCPECGTAFIIPTVVHGAEATVDEMIAPLYDEEPRAAPAPAISADEIPPPPPDETDEAAAHLDVSVSPFAASELKQAAVAESMLHIPCPNGHELETPPEMVGHRARCPHCGVEFRLLRKKSTEFLRAQEIIDRRRARMWFQLSIVVGSFVVIMLLAMVMMAIFSD